MSNFTSWKRAQGGRLIGGRHRRGVGSGGWQKQWPGRTRKEELLVEKATLTKMWVLRRVLMQMGPVDAMEFLLDKLKTAKNNEDFFTQMNS